MDPTKECATIYMIVDALQKVLLETPFPWPLLLDYILPFIGQIEEMRMRAVEVASQNLNLHEEAGTYPSLSPKKVQTLRDMSTDYDKNARLIFTVICKQLSRNYVYYVYTTDRLSVTKTLKTLFDCDSDETQGLWLQVLSDKDRAQLQSVRQGCMRDLAEIVQWEDNRKAFWKKRWPKITDKELYQDSEFFSYKRDFQHAFGSKMHDMDRLCNIIKSWASRVEAVIRDLEQMSTDDESPLPDTPLNPSTKKTTSRSRPDTESSRPTKRPRMNAEPRAGSSK